MNDTKTIILAAGEGSRMHSQKPKVLHQVCGENILDYVIVASKASGITDIGVIVGFQAELVKASLAPQMVTYYQPEQLGTGHAVVNGRRHLFWCSAGFYGPLCFGEKRRKINGYAY